MFSGLRLRLLLSYVGLSSIVYLLLIALSVTLFHIGLTRALDQELAEVVSELIPTIEDEEYPPSFGQLPEKIHSKPIRLLACIFLFDKDGKFLMHIGRKSPARLKKEPGEFTVDGLRMRSICEPLRNDSDKLVGYLQVELPTQFRDISTKQFAMVLLITLPIVLCALSATGYVLSGWSMRPIENSFALLSRFLLDASHELKTPLAIAQASLENLQLDLGECATGKERLSVISRSIDKMSRLTSDMLFLARAESGQINNRYDLVDILPLLTEVVDDFQPLYHRKSVALEFTSLLGPAGIICKIITDDFQRIIANLLDNALRHTEAEGTVHVSIANNGKVILIQIQDNGIGIPKESLPLIFNRFYRVDDARSSTHGGSGLGLAIVKVLVEAMGGTIEATSSLGKGTTFTLKLPLSKA